MKEYKERGDSDRSGSAAVMISFDFELGWGSIENGLWRKREAEGVYDNLSRVLTSLLEELDLLEIPVTWATVGGMLEGMGDQDLGHLPEPARDHIFKALRNGQPSTFDGRNLFEMIASTRTKHQFACHTYTHTRFTYPGVNEACVRCELENFQRVFPGEMHIPDRLVFPQNQGAYYSEVAAHGFRVVRGSEKSNENANRMAYLLSALIQSPPMVARQELVPGLHCDTGSMFFNCGRGQIHRLPFVYSRSLRGLNRAIKEQATFHVWNHPFNFSEHPSLFSAFTRFLRRIAKERDAGHISIMLM